MTATWVKGWVESTEGGSSMSHWKQQTREGNRLFDCGEYHQALAHYQQALWLARQQLVQWHDADEAVAALVVAHHNLADLLVAMTLPDRAADLLCYVHDCLLATCHSPRLLLSPARGCFAPYPHNPCRVADVRTAPRQPRRDHAFARSLPVSERALIPTPLIRTEVIMSHTLPVLNYAYDALEPHIDALTMEIHHSRHHQTYINNLNAALEGASELAALPVEDLLRSFDTLPATLQGGGTQPWRRPCQPLPVLAGDEPAGGR